MRKILSVSIAVVFLLFSPAGFSSEKDSVRIMAIGDQGDGGEVLERVAISMDKVASLEPVQAILLLGDNFNPSGVRSVSDDLWQSRFEMPFSKPFLNVPFYAVCGNHDYLGSTDAQVAYSKKSGKWKMPFLYYTFTLQAKSGLRVQFFALDTVSFERRSPERSRQLLWLESALKDSSARWKVVFGHHPVYSYGLHGGEDSLQKELLPLLKKYKVDFYFSGHDHIRQIIEKGMGCLFVVSGASSRPRSAGQGEGVIFSSSKPGFVCLHLARETAVLQCVEGSGQVDFKKTIEKPL